MADKPWSNRPLSEGQIRQALERNGCVELIRFPDGRGLWKPPAGFHFFVRYEECDAAQLEVIVEQLRAWVEQHRAGRD